MDKQILKLSLACFTGIIILSARPERALAYEEPIAGFPYDKFSIDSQTKQDNATLFSLAANEIPMPGFDNLGIADVETNLMIRKGKGTNEKIVGKLPKNGGCEILEADDGSGWAKIKSGKVTGYVKSSYLITGPRAARLALEVGNLVATVNDKSSVLNIRKEPTTSSPVVDQVARGEELVVLDPLVVSYGEDYSKWVKVQLDGDDEEESYGYVFKELVDLSYQLKKAFTIEELEYGAGVSSLRVNLISKAKQYLGYPYVWGGNSLTKGVDCSGFVKEIYEKFGYYLPRVSRSQAKSGTKISASKLKPGDLVFYGNSSTGYINHVAIYIGNNKIIHASNPRDGIKISNMYYRTPVKYVRYIKD